MHKVLTPLALPLLLAGAALPGLAQAGAPAAQKNAAWNAQTLANAKYVILPARIEGNANLVSAEQRAGILGAMQRDSGGAIKRRYPGATILTDPQTPGAIRVTPILVAPGALLPWAKLTARLHFDLAGGQRVSVQDQFGLITLWQHQAEAANYLYNELAKKLP
ncbi:hypothetical protein [Deinococcus budaensis]|uniref:Uncharacterized protein n=1 Tax=Deinococcus budaensis TaxID=1665626 RepID=A0A7W8LP42_9DEIO|nr:hypothetical protein [Deinococcus budaensis]MBB5233150.1 hypothetical protein [Deinococcus budaensis]